MGMNKGSFNKHCIQILHQVKFNQEGFTTICIMNIFNVDKCIVQNNISLIKIVITRKLSIRLIVINISCL
eukprot:12817916-Ditylum_brightwellii.AAC.1